MTANAEQGLAVETVVRDPQLGPGGTPGSSCAPRAARCSSPGTGRSSRTNSTPTRSKSGTTRPTSCVVGGAGSGSWPPTAQSTSGISYSAHRARNRGRLSVTAVSHSPHDEGLLPLTGNGSKGAAMQCVDIYAREDPAAHARSRRSRGLRESPARVSRSHLRRPEPRHDAGTSRTGPSSWRMPGPAGSTSSWWNSASGWPTQEPPPGP